MVAGMLTIKEYAEKHGKSVQAVYQQMKSKENAKALEGHIIVQKVGNKDTKLLDEEAVRILESASMQAPQVIMQTDDKERIEQLQLEKEQLLIKVAEQAEQIAVFAQWKADHVLALAAADQDRLLLEGTKQELDRANKELEQSAQELQQRERSLEMLQNELETSKTIQEQQARELEEFRNRSRWERFKSVFK